MMAAPNGRRRVILLLLPLLAAAAATAQEISDVRLTGSSSPRQGRLEVKVDGKWYDSVCQTAEVEDVDSLPQVVCRQLGFTGGVQYFRGEGGSSTLQGNLDCTGNETVVEECAFEATTKYGCSEDESEAYYVGVVCEGAAQVSAIRLVDGSAPSEGRVEVQVGGQWGPICDSLGDSQPLADAICQQLGYTGPALYRSNAFFGEGDAAPVVEVLQCSEGEDSSLDDCTLALDPPSCFNPGFGVACNGSESALEIRLTGGASPQEGQLEVKVNGKWAGVCHTSWPESFIPTAQVACRQLGYGGGTVRSRSFFGTSPSPAALADLDCDGSEDGLAGCSFSGPSGTSCTEEDGVGIACTGSNTIRQVRLADGGTPQEGRLEVLVGDQWGTVGGSGADAPPARVVCAQLGFGGGALRGGNFYGAGTVPERLENLKCTGNETNLNECSWANSNWGQMHVDDYSVACNGSETISDLRLVNGDATGGAEGRLEVLIEGQWGTVCDWVAWFNQGAADVACRQLGFSGPAQLVQGSMYSQDESLPIIISHVDCSGDEPSLNDCSFDANDPNNPTCTHTDDVGLICKDNKKAL